MFQDFFSKKLIFFILSIFSLIQVQAATEILPEFKKVFQTEVKVSSPSQLKIQWTIAPNYFLFANKFRLQSNTPGITFGDLSLPTPQTQQDDFFGSYQTYTQQLEFTVPLKRTSEQASPLNFSMFAQGCLSIENCYPSHEEKFNIQLPPASISIPSHTSTELKPSSKEEAVPQYVEEDEFLDPEVAFLFSTRLSADQQSIRASWQIAEGYYLYRNKIKFESHLSDVLGNIQWPKGELKKDEFFGTVEIYHGELNIDVPLKNIQEMDTLSLKVSYQGCAEAGLCYPPQHKNQSFSLTTTSSSKTGIQALLNNTKSPLSDLINETNNPEEFNDPDAFLDPDVAFQFAAEMDGDTLVAHWQIAEGYYLYRHKFDFNLKQGTLGEVQLPSGKVKQDEYFGRVETYYYQAVARLPVSDISSLDSLELTVKYQGCAEAGLCYPPMDKTVVVPLNAATSTASTASTATKTLPVISKSSSPATPELSEQDMIAKSLANDSVFWILVTFFGFGLLLALTPCVFPMIPILSSIIVGQGDHLTTRKAFVMSLTYVLAMALTYAFAGALAAVLGENIQAIFQNPWALWTFALVFVALAFSMFGFYDLQLPSSLQSKLTDISNKQSGGTLFGVAIMGFLSALIVGPCVAAPLAGALIYISQTGNVILGFFALFFMSLGMGVPLLLIGTSAGKVLPRAGGWMDTVKYVFGVLLLATGVWMLDRVIAPQATMILAALLLIIPAIYMGALDSLEAAANGWRKFWKGLAVAMLIYGALLIIGAASGSSSLLQPLKGLSSSSTVVGANGTQATDGLPFEKVKGIEGLQQALAKAKAAGQAVMLDFYADWCISCIEMEHYTFSDKRVQQALANTLVLQTDVTANDAQDKALLKHFGLFGPPAIIFYTPTGEELKPKRLVGFKPADEFLTHLKSL